MKILQEIENAVKKKETLDKIIKAYTKIDKNFLNKTYPDSNGDLFTPLNYLIFLHNDQQDCKPLIQEVINAKADINVAQSLHWCLALQKLELARCLLNNKLQD